MSDLKQSEKNSFTVIGVLKTKELEYGEDQKGNEIIKGHVVIEYKVGDKLNNVRLDVYASRFTKAGKESSMFKGFSTVLEEYKDKDTYPEEADRIKARGDINFNIFKSSNGNVIKTNRFRVSYFTRSVDENAKDGLIGTVTATILGYSPEIKDDEPTGFLNVNAFTVGYGGRVSPLAELKVADNIGMESAVTEHDTINLSYHYFNYVVVKKSQESSSGNLFGQYEDVAQTDSYNSLLQITGAKSLDNQDDALSEDDIALAIQAIRRAEQEVNKEDDDKKAVGFGGVKKTATAVKDPFADDGNVKTPSEFNEGFSEDDF